jgi:hypothetical protein
MRAWSSAGGAFLVLVDDTGATVARKRGYRRLRLETGPAQPEAVAMCRALGYARTPEVAIRPCRLAFEKVLGTAG